MTSPRGSGWFTGGAIGMIVTGLVHLTSHLAPPPPGAEAAHEAMLAFTVTALGMTWSLVDSHQALSFCFATFSISVGVIDLYVSRALRPTRSPLAGLALVNALVAAAVAAIAGSAHVAPPLYLYALVAAVFAVSAQRSRAAAPSAP